MAIITDSLGRRWDSAKHPRDRKGRFIHTFRLVRLFDAAGGTKPWGVGRVDKINDEGHIDITVTKSRDGQKTRPGQKVTLSADKLESVNERASLFEAHAEVQNEEMRKSPLAAPNANLTEARKRGLGKQFERQRGQAGAGPKAFGMATGFSRADGEAAERVLTDPEGQRDPKARLLAGLWLDHERNAGQISDQDFIESMDELGVDPNITDSSPDGRTGLKPLVDEYNATNPERKAVVPADSWAEWENADGSRIGYTGEIVQGKSGKGFVKANVHGITDNEDGTKSREPIMALGGETTDPADFPSPDEISDALEGKFDSQPNKVNANIGGKKFSFTKGDDDDIYEVSVTDDSGEEIYSGEHDTSDTPSLGADLYESATGEEYTDDIGGSDEDILANIPDVDDEGNEIIPEQSPEENAKPEGGAPEDDDEEIADLGSEAATNEAEFNRESVEMPQESLEQMNGIDEIWAAVLDPEGDADALHLAQQRKNNPDDFTEGGILKKGRRVLYVDKQPGQVPTLVEVEVSESFDDPNNIKGTMGKGEGMKPLRRVEGTERPFPYAYRIVSEGEYEEALERGYFQTDGRANLVDSEGTVASLESTGEFYAPWAMYEPGNPLADSKARILRFNLDPDDGWALDPADGYIKTNEQIPVARLDKASPAFSKDEAEGRPTNEDSDTDIPELERDEDLEEDFRRTQDGPDPEPREGRSTDANEPADTADEPESDDAERDLWDVIERAETNKEQPVDYKDGWKVGYRTDAGPDGDEANHYFIDPDGNSHPFEPYEAGADEDGPTQDQRSDKEINADFEAARDEYNRSKGDVPVGEEPDNAQNQITEALEKSVIDGDPVPLRDGWALQVQSYGEDGDEEAASFIAPDGSVYPFDHTEVYEDPDGKSLDRRPDADMERDFQRTQAAHARNLERQQNKAQPDEGPEDQGPEPTPTGGGPAPDAPGPSSKLDEVRGLTNAQDRKAWIQHQDDETLRRTLADLAANDDGSTNDLVASSQIEGELKRRERGEAQQRVPSAADKSESPEDLLETDPDAPTPQSKPESVADLTPEEDEDETTEPDPDAEARNLDDEMEARDRDSEAQVGDVVSMGYRVGEWDQPSGRSVAEIVEYERDDLGNDPQVSDEALALLRNMPARNARWITTSRDDAARYVPEGEDDEEHIQEEPFPNGALVLTGTDGDGGHLVLDLEGLSPEQVEELQDALRRPAQQESDDRTPSPPPFEPEPPVDDSEVSPEFADKIRRMDNFELQREGRRIASIRDLGIESPEYQFVQAEIDRRKAEYDKKYPAWLTRADQFGIVLEDDDAVDAEIAEGFAGQGIEPTDELRRLYREREVALGRLEQLQSPEGEQAFRDKWTEDFKNFYQGREPEDPRMVDAALDYEREQVRNEYRDASAAYNAELISEITRQNSIQTPKEGDEDGRSDTGTDSGLPDPDGVPGGPAGGAQATPEKPSDGPGDLRSDRRRVHLAGKDVEVDEESRLTSTWDGIEARRMEKEGFSNPDLYELDSSNAGDFRRAVEASRAQNAYGAAVPVYSDEEYAQMRMFVTADGKTGIALRGDEMISAFSRKDAADKRPVPSMHAKMIAQGARRASSFDNHQPGIHAASGFRAVARRKWNDAEAPEGWNKGVFAKWNKGEPDIIWYAYDPEAVGKPYHQGDGVTVDTPEQAQSLVDRFLSGDRDFLNPPDRTEEDAGEKPVDFDSALGARRGTLEAASRGEIVDDVPFNPSVETGYITELRKVTFEDGTVAIVKLVDDGEVIDNNLAAEQVIDALGGKTPASIPFYYNGEQALLSDYVVGHHIKEEDILAEEESWLNVLQTPEGRAIAVADWLSLQNDRHAGNFLITPDGRPVAIDNDRAEFGPQDGKFSMFEAETFEMDPDAVDRALEETREWFEGEGLEHKWEFAVERAQDYREIHRRRNGEEPSRDLVYPEYEDEEDLTDSELQEAAQRKPMMYEYVWNNRQARQAEDADTDVPEPIARNPIYDQAQENLAEYEANKHLPGRIDGSSRRVYRREDGAIVTETWNVRENKTRQTIVHPDGTIENKTLDPSGIDWDAYKRLEEPVAPPPKEEKIDWSDPRNRAPVPGVDPDFAPDAELDPRDRVFRGQRPEWIDPERPGVPSEDRRIDPAEPTPSGLVRQEGGNGWARETGEDQDWLIAPDGKVYDLTQTYLAGDTPDTVAKRVRRQYYLELMEPPNIGETPPARGGDQILAVAERINMQKLNDLDFERTEPVQLPDEKFPPNDEQQAGNDAINAGKNIIMNAKAGVGKTTFLVGAAKRIKLAHPKKRILYNVFNRSVRAEAEGRMPDNVEVRTYHSIPMRWAPKWMTARIGTKGKGLTKLGEISEHIKARDIGDDTKSTVARKAMRAVDTYAFSADDEISLDHFGDSIDDYSDNERQEILGYANKIWEDWNSPDGKLKMTYDAARKRWALTRPNFTEPKEKSGIDPIDILFVDEAQDTPPVMAKIYADQKEFGIQLVVVGDPDQAINGFTGAINFLDDIAPEMDTHLPLTKSYRYGPAVADIANRFLQFKQSIGRVIGGGPESEIVRGMEDPDAILTRSNGGMIAEVIEQMEMGKKVGAPEGTKKDLQKLVQSARSLRTGFPMRQPHEDFAQYDTWQEFVEDAQSGDNPVAAKNYRLFTAFDFDTLKGFIDNLIEPGSSDPNSGVMAKMDKRYAPNGIVMDFEYGSGFNAYDYRELLEAHGFELGPTGEVYKTNTKWGKKGEPKMKKLFYAPGATVEEQEAKFEAARKAIATAAGVEPDVTVSTAHKAKGLEWDSVKLGSDFKGPTEGPNGELVMPEEQEINLAYVAVTRAAKRLDPGSLDWIYEYTDDNGGTPGDEPDPGDLDKRVERREGQLDDKKRSEAHEPDQVAPSVPENPDADVIQNEEDQESVEQVPAPRGLPEGSGPTVDVLPPKDSDGHDLYPLNDGYHYAFNEDDTDSTLGVDVFDPNGRRVASVQIDEDMTSNDMHRSLNDLIVNNFEGNEPDVEVEDIEPEPEPDPDAQREEERTLLQAFYSLNHEMGERDLFDGYKLARRDSTFTGWKIIDPNGEEHTIQIFVDNNTRKIPRQRAAADLIKELRNRDATEVPEQEQSFDDRYPELTGNESAEEISRKADELSALAKQIGPTDPDFIKVMTKALAYSDAARGGILPAREQILAAKADFPEGLRPRPENNDAGFRVADEVDHTGTHDMDYVKSQIPQRDGDIDINNVENFTVWDLGDGAPGYFGGLENVDGDLEVSIFRNNGQKEPILVDRFKVGATYPPSYAAATAIDSVERHKASRRKVGPSAADRASGDRVIDAFRRQDNTGLTQDELEVKVQLEYTFRGDDGELDFELFERLLASQQNPTLTNFLKYMEDEDGPFRFWERGEEAGYKMRIGQHAWQEVIDSDKGRAHARGEGPPDIRHGRIIDMPTHSQPNITIWRHDENGQPMWVPSKKDPDIMLPHLSRYHMNRVNEFHGLHYDGTPMTADEAAAERGGPSAADFGTGVENTARFKDDGIDLFEYHGNRQFEFHEVYEGVPLTHAERMDLAARETDGFTDLRDGDNFTFDDGQKIVYDSETDQFVFFYNDRYHGFEDASEFQTGDRDYLADRVSGLGNGGGRNRTPDTEFTEVPESHWRRKYVEMGPFGDMQRGRIRSVFAYNGNEVVNRSDTVETYQKRLREVFLRDAKKAFDNVGDDLGDHTVTVDIPVDNMDPHFNMDPSGGTTLAYIVPFMPEQVNVNPIAVYKGFKHENFMPAAERDNNLEYVLTHELGHVHDSLNTNINGNNDLHEITPTQDAIDFYRSWFDSLSNYGKNSPHEAYAEVRAQWLMGGPGSSEVADAYAEKYGWPTPAKFADAIPEDTTSAPTDAPTGPVV